MFNVGGTTSRLLYHTEKSADNDKNSMYVCVVISKPVRSETNHTEVDLLFSNFHLDSLIKHLLHDGVRQQ